MKRIVLVTMAALIIGAYGCSKSEKSTDNGSGGSAGADSGGAGGVESGGTGGTGGEAPAELGTFTVDVSKLNCSDPEGKPESDDFTPTKLSACSYERSTPYVDFSLSSSGSSLLRVVITDFKGPGTYETGVNAETDSYVEITSEDEGKCWGSTANLPQPACTNGEDETIGCTIEVTDSNLAELKLLDSGSRKDGTLEATIQCRKFVQKCSADDEVVTTEADTFEVTVNISTCEAGGG